MEQALIIECAGPMNGEPVKPIFSSRHCQADLKAVWMHRTRIGFTRLTSASLAELSRYVVKATVPLEECKVLR